MRSIVATYQAHITVEVDLDKMSTLVQVDGARFNTWAPVGDHPVSDEELAEALMAAEERVELLK